MTKDLFKLKHGVIVACDVRTLEKLKEVVELTCDIEGIVGYKIGFLLALRYGLPKVVEVIQRHTDLSIIYDHQKAGTDIPQMGSIFANLCKKSGVNGVIVFPQSGPETEKAFVESLISEGLVPLVGGEMTHPKYLEKDGGFIRNDAVEEMYKYGAKLGVKYFIVPGNKPERIKHYLLLLKREITDPRLCMPGIGRQGGEIKSAFTAAKGAIATYAIVGSSIYNASNVREAARILAKEALGMYGS